MNIMNLYVYENRSMSNDLSRPLMLENLNVDTVQIHIPKEIDGTDMGTWAWWFVYQNAKREKYSIPMTLEGTTNDEGEEEYISTVGLNHGFTGKHGTVMYAIEALQADGSGTVTHEWHTKTYKLEVVYTLQGNQTEYSETESDIISALISRVNELITSGAEIAEIAATIEAAAETAQEVIDSIPPDYSSLSGQVATNTAAIALKADKSTTYTKTEVDQMIEDVEVETDTTLEVAGAAADAAETGRQIGLLKADLEDLDERVETLESGSGLTAEIKQALLACFEHVIFTDNVDDYYGNLYSALYETTWSITNILNECTSNNAATSVNKGASYTATLTPKEFYEITAVSVVMGGVDVTNTVYNAGVINIPSVTGAVVINATATLSLPSGYTALNYILTTGTEYAESGIYETATPLSCETKIRRTSWSTTTPNAHILSANNSYYSYLGTTKYNSVDVKYVKTKFNGAAASENDFEWELNTDYVIVTDTDNLVVTIDGTSVGSFVLGNTYDASNQYTIATYGGSTTQTKYRFVGRIYYIKLYDSNGTVHYFQPALRTNDNVAGFYDLATDTFITSATATAFTGA